MFLFISATLFIPFLIPAYLSFVTHISGTLSFCTLVLIKGIRPFSRMVAFSVGFHIHASRVLSVSRYGFGYVRN